MKISNNGLNYLIVVRVVFMHVLSNVKNYVLYVRGERGEAPLRVEVFLSFIFNAVCPAVLPSLPNEFRRLFGRDCRRWEEKLYVIMWAMCEAVVVAILANEVITDWSGVERAETLKEQLHISFAVT